MSCHRSPRSPLYPNSQWRTGFIGGDYRWLGVDGLSGRDLDDARAKAGMWGLAVRFLGP